MADLQLNSLACARFQLENNYRKKMKWFARAKNTKCVVIIPIRIITQTYRTLIESWPGRAWEKHNIGHWHSSEHVISRDHEPRARSWSLSAHVGSVRAPVRSSELETNLRGKKHTHYYPKGFSCTTRLSESVGFEIFPLEISRTSQYILKHSDGL